MLRINKLQVGNENSSPYIYEVGTDGVKRIELRFSEDKAFIYTETTTEEWNEPIIVINLKKFEGFMYEIKLVEGNI